METTQKLSWGLQPPEGVSVAWGARAIFEKGQIDLLWDRTSTMGDEKEVKKLGKWLNTKGLKGIRREVKNLQTNAEYTVIYKDDKYTIRANPRRSYGYLYLCAFPNSEKENE